MKFWGVSLLMFAVQAALAYLPGLGQVLSGILKGILEPLLAVGKFIIGAAAGAIGFGIQGLGSAISNNLIQGFGAGLLNAGRGLIQGAKAFFVEGAKSLIQIKEGGFFKVSSWIGQRGAEELNVRVTYGDVLSDGVRFQDQSSGMNHLLNLVEAPKIPVPEGTASTTIRLLADVLKETAVSAAAGAISDLVSKGFSSPSQTARALSSPRAPPVNAAKIENNKLFNPLTPNQPFQTRIPGTLPGETYAFDHNREVIKLITDLKFQMMSEVSTIQFPRDVVFIHRSLFGHFGNMGKLRARGDWRSLVARYL